MIGHETRRGAITWYSATWVLFRTDSDCAIQSTVKVGGLRIPRGGEERPVLLPRDMYIYLSHRQTDRQRGEGGKGRGGGRLWRAELD